MLLLRAYRSVRTVKYPILFKKVFKGRYIQHMNEIHSVRVVELSKNRIVFFLGMDLNSLPAKDRPICKLISSKTKNEFNQFDM